MCVFAIHLTVNKVDEFLYEMPVHAYKDMPTILLMNVCAGYIVIYIQ